jgi:hypothetical protein
MKLIKKYRCLIAIFLLVPLISNGQTKEINIIVNNDETSTIKFGKEISSKKWMSCQSLDKPFEIDVSEKELIVTANGNNGPCKLRVEFDDNSKLDVTISATNANTASVIDLKSDKKIDKWIEENSKSIKSEKEATVKEKETKGSKEIVNEKTEIEEPQEKTISQIQKEKLAINPVQLKKQITTLLDNFYAYCTNIGNHKGDFETNKKRVKADIFNNNDDANIQTINVNKPPKDYTVDAYLTRLNIQKPYKKVKFDVKNIQILSDIKRDPSTGKYNCIVSYQQVYTVDGIGKESGKYKKVDYTTKTAILSIDVRTITDPATGEIYEAFKAFIQDIAAKSIDN